MKYECVIATRRDGPEALQVVERELHPPKAHELRIKVLAAPVSLPDVEARYGRTPFPPKIPFTPGYAVIGVVDAVGDYVDDVVGDRVAALTVYGGYSEYINHPEKDLIPCPATLDPAQASPLILNYIVAYQSLHRSAKVSAGDKALIIGASGGIGTAFLQLGEIAKLKMYAIPSKHKHHILTQYGAKPIDYHTQDFVEVMRNAEPDGIDAVFDGIGGDHIKRSFLLLRRGGVYVGYANPLRLSRMFRDLGQVILLILLPNGRSARYYSTGQSRLNKQPFMDDWAKLFSLLEDGEISPVIAARFPPRKQPKQTPCWRAVKSSATSCCWRRR